MGKRIFAIIFMILCMAGAFFAYIIGLIGRIEVDYIQNRKHR